MGLSHTGNYKGLLDQLMGIGRRGSIKEEAVSFFAVGFLGPSSPSLISCDRQAKKRPPRHAGKIEGGESTGREPHWP